MIVEVQPEIPRDGFDWGVELERLRRVTDTEADTAVAAYRAAHPGSSDVRGLVGGVMADIAQRETRRVPEGTPNPAFTLAPELPGWAHDADLLRKGQAVFNDYGLEMSIVLIFAGLPMGYASVHGALAMARVSDLATPKVTRRIGETGQMVVDVMGTRDGDSLAPGGAGYGTAVGLRLVHACVRSLLLDPDAPAPWPTRDLGPPVSQELLLGTLLDFTVVPWRGMERTGMSLSTDERAAHLYTWSVVGNLMGVEACDQRPLSLADVDEMWPLFAPQLGATEEGRRLTEVLLRTFESSMPLGWRKLPRSLVHWLFEDAPNGVDRVPELLGVRPAASWSRPLFRLMRSARTHPLLAPFRPLLSLLRRHLGRLVVLALVDGFAPDAPPFRIPAPLARSWRVRTGRIARGTRRLRGSVRQRARRRLPGLPPVGLGEL
jgi:hypothetical protein